MPVTIAVEYLLKAFADLDHINAIQRHNDSSLLLHLKHQEMAVIYVMDNLPTLKDVKYAINQNSHADIYTLFVVLWESVQMQIRQKSLPPVLELLGELYEGCVYVYQVDNHSVTIFSLNISDSHYEKMELSRFGTDYIRLHSKHMRGVRLIANFGTRKFATNRMTQAYHPLQRYYVLLNIPLTATEEEIKQAYRKLAQLHHPDVDQSASATARMQTINEAYQQIMKQFRV